MCWMEKNLKKTLEKANWIYLDFHEFKIAFLKHYTFLIWIFIDFLIGIHNSFGAIWQYISIEFHKFFYAGRAEVRRTRATTVKSGVAGAKCNYVKVCVSARYPTTTTSCRARVISRIRDADGRHSCTYIRTRANTEAGAAIIRPRHESRPAAARRCTLLAGIQQSCIQVCAAKLDFRIVWRRRLADTIMETRVIALFSLVLVI